MSTNSYLTKMWHLFYLVCVCVFFSQNTFIFQRGKN